MITDDERREVAEKLRERTKKPMGKSMQRMFTETLGMYTHNICWMNPDKATSRWDVIVNYLADLIDRPTARNIADFDRESFKCSRCGYRVLSIDGSPDAAKLVAPDGGVVDFGCCPNCRADVVEDD